MARRKPPANSNCKHRNVLAVSSQHAREHLPTRDAGMHALGSGAQNDGGSENKPRDERAFNNNNDHKYLHKKFKKMASAAPRDEPSSIPSNSSPPPPETGDEPLPNDTSFRFAVENNVQITDKECAEVAERREALEASPRESSGAPGGGRHVCPYCKLSCAKPSVLQKHIRAHTNERPYPCVPCGFAFKTKSNLYKHCRSRSHALKLHGTEETPNNEEEWSLGSETDSARHDSNSHQVEENSPVASEGSASDSAPSECLPSSLMSDSKPKSIYKPKFHKASFYREEDDGRGSVLSPNPEFLNRHISKIISQNEAIVDATDTPLHRKHAKENSNHRHHGENGPIGELSKGDNQPLNLTKNSESVDFMSHKKRRYSESFILPDALKVHRHPLNPEGSIIKDLLLKVRAQATGLLPITSECYDEKETLYVCPLCQISYKSAANLEVHREFYCKGNGNNESMFSKAEFIRSNSLHGNNPSETYTPNSLVKIATSTLKTPTKRTNKPENLILNKNEQIEISAPLPSPGPLLGNTRLVDTQTNSDGLRLRLASESSSDKIVNSSPLLKRRSESLSSEGTSTISKYSDECFQRSDLYSPPNKIRCAETPTLRSLEELSLSPMRQNSTSLQMFGGEVKIVDNAGGTTTMRIEPTTSQQSPTMISHSRVSPSLQGPETSSILVRSGLHSGATIVHNPPTPKEPLPSPHPQTPRLLVPIAPNINTPNLTVAGIPAPNISKFQFPIGPITAYNPLTLPPLSPASPCDATTIYYGGKLIPYVPGMPGPNTMNIYSSIQKNLKANSNVEANNDSNLSRGDKNWKDKQKNIFTVDSLHNNKMSDHKLSSPGIKSFDFCNIINPITNKDIISKNLHSPKISSSPVIVNYDDSSVIVKSTYNTNSDFNKRSAQVKIDELVRRNSEILQKSSTSVSDQYHSARIKAHSPLKVRKELADFSESNRSVPLLKIVDKEKKNSSQEIKQFNFENLISKSEILNKPAEVITTESTSSSQSITSAEDNLAKVPERSETSYFKKTLNMLAPVNSLKNDNQNSKFLRPSSLSLKPGTFTPKRHHGITPSANTLPLISPETPRPAKAYGQLYLNGHAYTYLGLKCSTKEYYCTLNKPQPSYAPNQHTLSMYSHWQVCPESAPHPLGLLPGPAMSHYDSRHRPQNISIAKIKQDHLMTHSSQWTTKISNQVTSQAEADGSDEFRTSSNDASSGSKSRSLAGGFESNEEYTYVRGRGRGRYVCYECGIRCKKPSMLKKHARTHTDVRPFTCKHCAFSFKTKGNLTKHMKSKAHFRKCSELGISPMEGMEGTDMSQGPEESDDDTDTEDDGNEGETESSDTDSCKSRLEHEAAHCLLSLCSGRPAPGLLTTARPTTYPYTPNTTEMSLASEESKFPESSMNSPSKDGALIVRKPSPNQSGLKYDKAITIRRNNSVTSPMDLSKPMDLRKNEAKENNVKHERSMIMHSAEEILTPVGEPDFLASLSLSADKFPQLRNWNDDEPMFQVYLKEKALQDSRIKQCQYTNGKLKQHEMDLDSSYTNNMIVFDNMYHKSPPQETIGAPPSIIVQSPLKPDNVVLSDMQLNDNSGIQTLAEIAANSVRLTTPPISNTSEKKVTASTSEKTTGTENAKFVASVYLKSVSGKSTDNNEFFTNPVNNKLDKISDTRTTVSSDENSASEKDSEVQKLNADHIGIARKVVVGADGVGFKLSPFGEFPPQAAFSKAPLTEDGRSVCVVCNKSFSKQSQLRLHVNIHYIERPFRCSACAVSFRTRGHLQKHERSGSHHNKVSMTSTFGAATTTNPRPFKCSDCKIAFRIHGHLAKHLRSKMHVMRLECLGKLPFGTFAEIERAGVSLTDIDTTDCDHSLMSLQVLAQKLHEKDPTKLEKWVPTATTVSPSLLNGNESSDEGEPSSPIPNGAHGDGESKNVNDSDSPDETCVKYSATNT